MINKKLEYEKPWFKAQTPILISINVENMSRVNEDLSHIRIEGTIEAIWEKERSFSNTITKNYGSFIESAKYDFLKAAYLNFTSAEEQKFTKLGEIQESNSFRKSTYRFEGNFPLIRDLRKFPFDKAIWEIELSHPLNAAIFYPEYINSRLKPGDILVGKVTPKGDTASGPEEKLLRSIFGEKAIDVTDTSLRMSRGSSGTVVDVRVFNRHGIEKDERSITIERAEIEQVQQDKIVEEEILERSIKQRASQILSGYSLSKKIKNIKFTSKI
mgnify:CR=1 FL=1